MNVEEMRTLLREEAAAGPSVPHAQRMAGVRSRVQRSRRRRASAAGAALVAAVVAAAPFALGDRADTRSLLAVEQPDRRVAPQPPMLPEDMNGAHLFASAEGGVSPGVPERDVVLEAAPADTGNLGWAFGCRTDGLFEFTFLVNEHEVMRGFCGPGSPFENWLLVPPVTDAGAAREWWGTLGVDPDRRSEFRLRVDAGPANAGAASPQDGDMAALALYAAAPLIRGATPDQLASVAGRLALVMDGRPTVFAGIAESGTADLLVVLEPGVDPEQWTAPLREAAGPSGWRLAQAPRSARWLDSRLAHVELLRASGDLASVEGLVPLILDGKVSVAGDVSTDDRRRLEDIFDGAVTYVATTAAD